MTGHAFASTNNVTLFEENAACSLWDEMNVMYA